MYRCLILSLLVGTLSPSAASYGDETLSLTSADWPWWRGPQRNGLAHSDQSPPLRWSETDNVLWRTQLPGRGHGSPTVVGDHVYLATADHTRELQLVICFDRRDGSVVWETVVHRGGLDVPRLNQKASQASSTVACDGERVFINFFNDGAVWTTALTRGGERLWQRRVSSYVIHQGYASSPAIYGSMVIVSADNKSGGAIVAFERSTGKEIWRRERPKLPNYASPIVLEAAGKEQLVFIGCDLVTSFNPETGTTNWEIAGATTECVTSTVTDGELVITSGGYPKNHVAAVRADGSGEIVWEKDARVYVPSMLIRDGYLYGVRDNGIAFCWKCSSGDEVWRGRLRGTFSASPVIVGEYLLATNESGRTFVCRADPAAFELIAENDLGDHAMATPTVCDSRIYMRVAKQIDGERQEVLFCLGSKDVER